MAGGANLLTDTKIKGAKERARLRDGEGLWLNVSNAGNKTWVYRWARGGKAREIGLGSYPAVSLSNARDLAIECRAMVANGLDPKSERNKQAEPTFKECVAKFLEARESEWSNAKHRHQWRQTLGSAYCSHIENMRVSQITTNDVIAVLREPWQSRPETASRLRGRIERVLAFAKVKGWRDGDNPATWRGNLKEALPSQRNRERGHFKALPYKDVPSFMETLKQRPADAARALELLIYTVGRPKNVLEARWEDIDLENKLWTIPAPDTKTKKEYLVPLSNAAIVILQPMYKVRHSSYVFSGQRRGKGIQKDKPLSGMAMEMLLRRMEITNATPHGFRSSFRDWSGDQTSFDRETLELCLAHSVGNKTEQAYRRSSAIEKRRIVLNAWADYCNGLETQKVVQLHG